MPGKLVLLRHGQSQWNAAQTASRRSGVPEDETKALGRKEEFTDSPLSALGVRQGLNLQRRLFEDPANAWEETHADESERRRESGAHAWR